MAMKIERLDPERPSDCDALVRIYQSAIERSEQKPEAALRALLRDWRYDVLIARDVTGVVQGFSMVFHSETRTFGLLEYMAVAQEARGSGIGAHLFSSAAAAAAERSPTAPGILEVDVPPVGSASSDDRARRFRFYERQGCRRLSGIDYILPLDTHGAPPPMTLLIYDPVGRPHWPLAMVATWLEALYVEVYGTSRDDSRIAAMMASLSDRVAVSPIAST